MAPQSAGAPTDPRRKQAVTEYSPLQAEIKRLIKTSGPMPVWRYMELCLTHPEHGYYVSRDPLGREGDFTTAPEVSQMQVSEDIQAVIDRHHHKIPPSGQISAIVHDFRTGPAVIGAPVEP